ncbi:Multifunctional conjugation protein TraI [Stieleria neptunia]|uniref:Multifunctional conjugation protein TraI n=1 Tax=Stieleria neptunia TaxID=2527979 RepID=A0A518HSU5_9BACT|nr:MobF family relaxase [Stieleria neptunia]QDV43906.1 Multifunctional conjugation protein TraI [Stieleria neptunia]
MLSIKLIGGSSTEVNYYANLGDAENHDYYSEDGSRPGVYFGAGARKLGLEGEEVSPETFKNLLEGLSPDGKERLVQQRKKGQIKRRAGFDLTFSMSKSYSLAWSQADRETRTELDRRARSALNRTLEFIEEMFGKTRRGKDGVRVEDGKLTFAVFSHDTARGIPGEVPDVNRHFHAVLANVAMREDGSSGAVDARPLFHRRSKMMLGAMFRAELSKELESMGLGTHRAERDGKKASWFELDCVPESLIQASSKRRGEIQKWLRDRGLTGAKAAELAALRTREGKEKWSQEELFTAWRELAKEHGFTREVLDSAIGQAREFVQGRELESSVNAALESLMKSKARFTEIELLESAAVEVQCRGLGINEIRSGVEALLTTSNEIVRLEDDQSGARTFTTREMLELEKRMIGCAQRLNGKHGHAVAPEFVTDILNDYQTLREEQCEAVRFMLSDSDIACVNGVAGSGKTFMLGVARQAWETAGYQVLGTALAAKAARGLEDGSGIQSIHIHKLLRDIEKGEAKLDEKSVVVLDESGMVGTRQMEKLLSVAESAGAKLVLIGDCKQLQAIDAGAAFRGIAEEIGYTSLEEIIRQREVWSRKMVKDLRDGRAEDALSELHSRGGLFIGSDRDEAKKRLVEDWREYAIEKRELKETLVFAGTNIEVRELNRLLQAERKASGEPGEASIEVDGMELFLGDRVMVTRNNNLLCVRNGTLAEVVSIEGEVVSLRLDDGFTVEVDTKDFSHLTLGYAMSVHKGQGVTCENSLIMTGDSMTDREMSYVEGSRAKTVTMLYADELSSGQMAELASRMNVSRQAELAYEYEIG